MAADDGWKGAFHAGADYDAVGFAELFADGEDAVRACDADVVEAGNTGAEEFGGDRGFFGDREVAGAGADNGDVALFIRGGWGLTEGEAAGLRVVAGGGDEGVGGFGCCRVTARGEDVGAGGGHASEDPGGLGGGFAGGEDDLGQAGAEGAVVVNARLAGVLEGEVCETAGGLLGGEGATLNFSEEG